MRTIAEILQDIVDSADGGALKLVQSALLTEAEEALTAHKNRFCLFTLACSRCNASSPAVTIESEVVDAAVDNGWSVSGHNEDGVDLCPACKSAGTIPECMNCGILDKPLEREHCQACICPTCKRTASECGESMAGDSCSRCYTNLDRDKMAQAFGWADWRQVVTDSLRDGYLENGGRGKMASVIGRLRREAEDLIEYVERYHPLKKE